MPPTPTSAETAYLFRHALLRDAAYELQLPTDRVKLHGLALMLIESVLGGPAPTPAPLDTAIRPSGPHATDSAAVELAEHARLALGTDDGHIRSSMTSALRKYLQRGAEYAERRYSPHMAARCWKALAEVLDGPQAGEAMRRAGLVLLRSGGVAESEDLLRRAIELQLRHANTDLQRAAMTDYASLLLITGRIEQAEQELQNAIAIPHGDGGRRQQASLLANMAVVHLRTGRMQDGERLLREALELHRALGNRHDECGVMCNLGLVLENSGRVAEAEQTFFRAREIATEVGNLRAEVLATANLATLHKDTGRLTEAEAGITGALALARKAGDRAQVGVALGNLASVFALQGRHAEAEEMFLQALATHREGSNSYHEAIDLANLAALYNLMGKAAEAQPMFLRALEMHRRLRNVNFEGGCRCEYALCLLARGDHAAAREQWREGAGLLSSVGDTTELDRATRTMRDACKKAGLQPFDD